MSRRICVLIDMLCVFAGALLAVVLREGWLGGLEFVGEDWIFACISAITAALVWPFLGVSRVPWQYFTVSDTFRLLTAVAATVLVALFAMFTINRSADIARSVPVLQLIATFALLLAVRMGVRHLMSVKAEGRPWSTTNRRQHVIVVGLNRLAEIYIACVDALYSEQASVVAILDDNPRSKGLVLKGKPVVGKTGAIEDVIRRYRVHGVEVSRIVVTLADEKLSPSFQHACARLTEQTSIQIDHFERLLGLAPQSVTARLDETPDSAAFVASKEQRFASASAGRYEVIKRFFDIAVSSALIAILAPVFLMLSAAIAFDVGRPVMFWQERPGLHRRPFRVYKFRTMRDAYDGQGHLVPEDQRLSALGSALRRVRLDEIPQLFNILLGDMSFVGPRPLLAVDQPQQVDIRLSMRPGLTGWAQINGGRDLSIADKGALDIWYVRNASFGLDLKILLSTAKFVLTGERPPAQEILAEARRALQGSEPNADRHLQSV
ncbi:sugar transferase [Consotaella aegiceratis]|uniref:sugar transferase n=1 Tax=Consotaella aegiceratis TaxID=3097961 RepID=UPI002F42762C